MNTFSIVWDVMMTGEAITQKKSDALLAKEMEAFAPDLVFNSVQRWNYVAQGKKVSAAGFTNGIRFTSFLDNIAEAEAIISRLGSFSNPLAQSSNCRVAESIPFPLERSVKQRLPQIGRMALKTSFTHGLGETDHKKISNAKSDQTRLTKDGLDPIRKGKNSSAAWFSDEFRNLMSSSNWFLVMPTYGKTPSEVLGSRGSDGGMYEFSFNLQPAIDELTKESKGVWWNELNETQASSLNPTLMFDPSQELESEYDPLKFTHFTKTKDRIDNVIKFEEKQNPGDDSSKSELEYNLERITRGRRLVKQATSSDGLVSGMEEFVIKSKFIAPFLTEEFFNALAFFVMTRHPKFWRNGRSEILIFHDEESIKKIELW